MSSLSTGTGLSFGYKIEGFNATFYIGSIDSQVPAVIEKNNSDNVIIKWSKGAAETLTYVSEKSADEFTYYSNINLEDMAIKYYEKNFNYTPSSVASVTNDDGTVSIQLYDNLGDHNSTSAWYTVDRITAVGVNDLTEEAVD